MIIFQQFIFENFHVKTLKNQIETIKIDNNDDQFDLSFQVSNGKLYSTFTLKMFQLKP